MHVSGKNLFLHLRDCAAIPSGPFEVSLFKSKGVLVVKRIVKLPVKGNKSFLSVPLDYSLSSGVFLMKTSSGETFQCEKFVIQ